MKYRLNVCIVVALAVIPTFAQRPVSIEVGAYGGLPLDHTLQSNFCCTTAIAFFQYEPKDASYITGMSAGVLLYDHVHVSFGAMYMPVSFRSLTAFPLTIPVTSTHGTSWEFPLLGDYRWLSGAVRPFSGGGIVVRNRISGGDDQAPAPVISAGVEWVRHSFVIRPEFRYIHYPEAIGPNGSVGRPGSQPQFLVGFMYRL